MASPWIDSAAFEARGEPPARLPVRDGPPACGWLPGGAAISAGRPELY